MVWLAAICWDLWRPRNNICFEKKLVRSPTEIIFLASSFIIFCAELQGVEDRVALEAGGEALRGAAINLHPREAPSEDTGIVVLK
ncbi:hypothetical protein BAE44_0017622 [Dichanthelium oligosanthes]|uniref:Uncharacterized protein n=1 Tax=Dichanthelium oligosanthes TaxID=888268 RepID=A0A1E5V882_9POAL|nr:hypothetical protein BAE44_0017622 [Dichanthelium oligosanthes]